MSYALALVFALSQLPDTLPNTAPLAGDADQARVMVDGIRTYLERELAAAARKRDDRWTADGAAPAAFAGKRDRLKTMLGVVDARVPPNLEYVGGPGRPSTVREGAGCRVDRVRWAVLPGIDAEGFLIQPKGAAKANVVLLPDVGAMNEVVPGIDDYALHGCRVLIPTLIDRKDELSGSQSLKRQTNQPHREFVYRMAFEMGRTPIGFEVQKVLAGVDWFLAQDAALPVGVVGFGDGGMIALYAGAVDTRIGTVAVKDYFGRRERLHEQPIDRNVWGLLTEFGDAELARLHRTRPHLMFGPTADVWPGPVVGKPGRGGAAPGAIKAADFAEFAAEEKRIGGPSQPRGPAANAPIHRDFLTSLGVWVDDEFERKAGLKAIELYPQRVADPEYAARHKRQFDQLVEFTQKLWRDSDATRREFWKSTAGVKPGEWAAACEPLRRYFHAEVIGKLPDPTGPLNVRTRKVYDEPKWTGYEVVLDALPGVPASGILLLPKGQKPGERRPVVVCQHGLEGRPRDVVNPRERTKYYNSFGAQLADLGYIVYAPQNPYIFGTDFRQLQRLANPLKLSLFSFIVAQHRRTLDWLEALPEADPGRIAFYGLSYGGKTAVRVPAVEKRYGLSICSGDFNEWIGKNVSVSLDRSYMWTNEYEMPEFGLGATFNYAEMACLIAPRPFMVERGHDDGVGTDDMVAAEYAKVRYLYANRLNRPDHTEIEFFPGGHEVRGAGTFAFLKRHLAGP